MSAGHQHDHCGFALRRCGRVDQAGYVDVKRRLLWECVPREYVIEACFVFWREKYVMCLQPREWFIHGPVEGDGAAGGTSGGEGEGIRGWR